MKKIKLNPIPVFIILLFVICFLPGEYRTEETGNSGPIQRIVSLTPAVTRQLVDLDAEDLLVGVTVYHPPLSRKVDIVGTLVIPDIERIVLLKPDIVFASEEDNAVQFIDMVKTAGIRSHTFGRNDSFKAICDNYTNLAGMIGREELARKKIAAYKKSVKEKSAEGGVPGKRPAVAVFISQDPLMGVSDLSYIGQAVADAGGKNTMALLERPYPVISFEHMVLLNPDIVISIVHNKAISSAYFKRVLKDFSYLTAMKRDSFYTIPSDSICYYTPDDYVKAVELISDIIEQEKQKAHGRE
ncbi:MAG: ABC transporter substrate-binding protein [bacterium]|nr:ABC transporter substrate-binding protein [bacterium]